MDGKLEILLHGIKIGENIMGHATRSDMYDTQNEMYRIENEMRGMVDGLTLDQRRELNEKIKTYCTDCKMENMGKSK